MKYALIKNNIVEQISYPFVEGWEEVEDNVFAGMIKKEDGTFDNTDEVKQQIENNQQELTNKENKKASGRQKLKDLGLDDDEINELMGV
tara:strand:+ start:569 stop:835 length:267 start_codon:yes stop_codon:yes gene_type:complete